MKERDVLRQILDYLQAEGILAFRRNVGAVRDGKRFYRFGTPGEADIECFLRNGAAPCWLECKTDQGKTSPAQDSFRDMVREHGHEYHVIRKLEQVMWLVHPERARLP